MSQIHLHKPEASLRPTESAIENRHEGARIHRRTEVAPQQESVYKYAPLSRCLRFQLIKWGSPYKQCRRNCRGAFSDRTSCTLPLLCIHAPAAYRTSCTSPLLCIHAPVAYDRHGWRKCRNCRSLFRPYILTIAAPVHPCTRGIPYILYITLFLQQTRHNAHPSRYSLRQPKTK